MWSPIVPEASSSRVPRRTPRNKARVGSAAEASVLSKPGLRPLAKCISRMDPGWGRREALRGSSAQKRLSLSLPYPRKAKGRALQKVLFIVAPLGGWPWESSCCGNRPGARQLRISSLEPRDRSGGGGAHHGRRPRLSRRPREGPGARAAGGDAALHRGHRLGRDRTGARAAGTRGARGGRGRPPGQRRGGL